MRHYCSQSARTTRPWALELPLRKLRAEEAPLLLPNPLEPLEYVCADATVDAGPWGKVILGLSENDRDVGNRIVDPPLPGTSARLDFDQGDLPDCVECRLGSQLRGWRLELR